MDTKLKIALGAVVGGGLGYAYYYYIGCASGTCAMTSSPYISVLYGAALGVLFNFPSKKKSKDKAEEEK